MTRGNKMFLLEPVPRLLYGIEAVSCNGRQFLSLGHIGFFLVLLCRLQKFCRDLLR